MAQNDFAVNKTDEELVGLALKEKEYYRYLMERYKKKLKRYIMRLSGLNLEDAQDVLQNVFFLAYENLNEFDTRLKFSSWIYRIAHNETISYLRKLRLRKEMVELDSEETASVMDLLQADLNVEEEAEKNYLKENISKIIKKLDAKYRSVVVLRYIKDKGYDEISKILRKPKGTIATLLRRAKEKLFNQLSKLKNRF